MSPPPPAPGALSIIGAAYRLAGRHRAGLLRATVPVLVPVTLVLLVLRLIGAGDRATIVDGVPLFDAGGRHFLPATLSMLVVASLGWCAVVAAAGPVWELTAAGTPPGTPLGRTGAVARQAVSRRWRILAGLAARLALTAVLVGSGLMFVAVPLTAALPGVLGLPLLAAVLLAGLLLLCRVALAVPAAMLENLGAGPAVSRAFEVTRGRVWQYAGVVLVGAGVLPLLALLAVDALADALAGASATGPGAPLATVVPALARTLGLAAVPPVQAAVLAVAYLAAAARVAEAPSAAGAAETRPAVPGVIGAAPDRASPAPLRSIRRRFAVTGLGLALVAPAVLVGVTPLVNPYRVPVVRTGHVTVAGPLLAVGLPTAGGPVLVDGNGVVDCADAACRSVETHTDSMIMAAGGIRAAAVARDGSVRYVTVDPGRGRSADARLRSFRCSRSGGCAESTPLYTWPAGTSIGTLLAVTVAPDGTGPTVAALLGDGTPEEGQDELAVYPCADPACQVRREVRLGRVPGVTGSPSGRPLAVTVDAAGGPVVGYRAPDGGTWLGTCESAACRQPRLRLLAAGDGRSVGMSQARSTEPTGLPGIAVVVAPDGRPVLLDGAAGAPPRLWHCDDPRCTAARASYASGAVWIGPALAVTPDGRPLVGLGTGPDDGSAGPGRPDGFGGTVQIGPASAPDPIGRLGLRSCPAGDCDAGRTVRLNRDGRAGPVSLTASTDGELLLVYPARDGGYVVASLRAVP